MEDIYDIKDVINWYPINFDNSVIFIIFILFLVIFYNFLSKNQKQLDSNIEEKIVKEEINYTLLMQNFEKKYISSNNELFYSKLLEILRKILEENDFKNISKMTYEEINNLNLDWWLKDLIQNMYFKEYSKNINDSKEVREWYIIKVRKLIK